MGNKKLSDNYFSVIARPERQDNLKVSEFTSMSNKLLSDNYFSAREPDRTVCDGAGYPLTRMGIRT